MKSVASARSLSRKSAAGRSRVHSERIFLLSPANIAGRRAALLLNPRAEFDLAACLRAEQASLGQVFSFISGLYFRGKLTYASTFAQAPPGISGAFVITASGGLVAPETPVSFEQLRNLCAAQIDLADHRYRTALDRDARALAASIGKRCQVVLLGSIATPKYTDPLLEVFGDRLFFPAEFIGRGDMSRGGLMLRCVQAGVPLTYVPVRNAQRHGPKPPKLTPMRLPA
jgi:hypothetical protein